MNLSDKLARGRFVATMEIEPPKGIVVEDTLSEIIKLSEIIDAFNVTDMQSSMMRMSSWALAVKLVQRDLEPVLQMTARDRNSIAIQGDLLGSNMLGIRNLLLLTGDGAACGDHPFAREVFELDSLGLIKLAAGLNGGRDASGKEITGRPGFFIGAALNPMARDQDKELKKMEEKIKAGASFFQTQPVFDPDKFYKFMKRARNTGAKILAGIIFLKSPKMAKYLRDNISGIDVPESYIKRVESASSKREEAVNIARELVRDFKDICQGVHIMPLGWYKEVAGVFDER